MRIYLAARYSRIDELNEYKQDLRGLGHYVTSRWLEGEHRAADDDESRWAEFAADDLEDIDDADMVINFTEPPREPSTNRGGRHVEFGYALAGNKFLIVVGPNENTFHPLADLRFDSWFQCLDYIEEYWRVEPNRGR